MPSPYLSLSFETIEARHWASELIDNVFTTSPKEQLTPCIENKPLPLISINNNNNSDNTIDYRNEKKMHHYLTKKESLHDLIHHSTSSPVLFLSDHHFSLTPSLNSISTGSSSTSASRSSSTTSSSSSSTAFHSDSDLDYSSSPTTTATTSPILSRKSTLTKQLKKHLTLDELSSTTPTTTSIRKLFNNEQLQRERKATLIWRETLHNYLLDPHFLLPTPRLTKNSPRLAYCIISELLATEETYLGHLLSFKQIFVEPFLHKFQNRYVVRDLQVIFSYMPTLITLSNSLIRRWRVSIERQSYFDNHFVTVKDGHLIGKSFCDLEDEFKVYTYYAAHYGKAQRCISKMERKPNYQEWIHSVLQNKELQRMGLADFLISPIQRITRYCLLVKDLLKHTDGNDMELERTYKYLTALASAMNSCQ
ncbi:unnamed protein product [Cunninghamella blakesleeana]